MILCGVGGQGVLSIANIISLSAMKDGLFVRQSEVHGMAQRGGPVVAHLRVSQNPIESDLIPQKSAQLIISMEPVEGLRYLKFLSPNGTLVTSTNKINNIPNYPAEASINQTLSLLPNNLLVPAEELAKKAGSAKTVNTVMVGAASKYLPMSKSSLRTAIKERFNQKGEKIVAVNIDAFDLGRAVQQSLYEREPVLHF